jgi:hypothetical protein
MITVEMTEKVSLAAFYGAVPESVNADGESG